MNILAKHEEFEMEILDHMRRLAILDQLVFGGATMLRLCFSMKRYSSDFDFYLARSPKTFRPWIRKLTGMLSSGGRELTDHQNKRFSLLWEVRQAGFPRKLKLEIRKAAPKPLETEMNIAFSPHSTRQVRLNTLTLAQMWRNKIAALLDRREIRDAYDLEFLLRRRAGSFLALPAAKLKKIEARLRSFKDRDFKVTLGSVLEPDEREFHLQNRFNYLVTELHAALSRATTSKTS